MARAEVAGKYAGFVTEKAVGRGHEGKGIQLVARCNMLKWWDKEKKAWTEIDPVQETAYLVLQKKDGGINEHQVDNCMRAFGWSGKSTKELHTMDVSKIEVVFDVKPDLDSNGDQKKDKNTGKPAFEVAWINPMGGLRPVKAEDVEDIDKEWKSLSAAPTPAAEGTEKSPW